MRNSDFIREFGARPWAQSGRIELHYLPPLGTTRLPSFHLSMLPACRIALPCLVTISRADCQIPPVMLHDVGGRVYSRQHNESKVFSSKEVNCHEYDRLDFGTYKRFG